MGRGACTRLRVSGSPPTTASHRRARAQTAALGPGYQHELTARLDAFAERGGIKWAEPPERDLAEIEAEMCGWIADELAAGTRAFGMPKHRTFIVDAPVVTPLGPRDAAWRDAVIAEPARAADMFAWRKVGDVHRARALYAMWFEVPWREPLDEDEEDVMEGVHDDLCAALDADPDAKLPFVDWGLLLDLLGRDDDRARNRAGGRATIGYRRYDMEVDLSGGWTAVLPGAFLGGWDDGGERFVATDGKRGFDFTSLTADGELDCDRLLAVAPEKHAVAERFADDTRRGRVEMSTEGELRVVHGLMAAAPHVAIATIRCKPADEAWALAAWRSLQRSAGARCRRRDNDPARLVVELGHDDEVRVPHRLDDARVELAGRDRRCGTGRHDARIDVGDLAARELDRQLDARVAELARRDRVRELHVDRVGAAVAERGAQAGRPIGEPVPVAAARRRCAAADRPDGVVVAAGATPRRDQRPRAVDRARLVRDRVGVGIALEDARRGELARERRGRARDPVAGRARRGAPTRRRSA